MSRLFASILVGGHVGFSTVLLGWASQSCASESGETHLTENDATPDSPISCTTPFSGDKTKEATIELVMLGADGTSSPIADGGTAPLILPPQGGRVVFAGVHATNLDPCGVELSGVIRDETTKQIRLDTRTVNLKPSDGGWVASDDSDISTFANIPLCPNQWSTTNIYGTEYELAVTVTDSSARIAKASVHVVPACVQPEHEAECLCICQGGYKLGQSCDGGAGDAGAEGSLP